VPNVGAPNFVKYIILDLKTQVGPNTVIVGDFSTTQSIINSHLAKMTTKTTKYIQISRDWNTLLHDQWIIKEIRERIKKFPGI
jgi:hypothetical protein